MQQAVQVRAAQTLGLCDVCPGAEGGAEPEQREAVHGGAEAGPHSAAVRDVMRPDGQRGTAAALVGARMLADHVCRAVPLVPRHLPA